MMVPMADMLNHVANHNANLEFTPVRPPALGWISQEEDLTQPDSRPSPPTCLQDCLKMVCVRPVAKGQEVFNTYGQMANWQLLHMYGFAEPHRSNCNDTADVPVASLYQAATQGHPPPDLHLIEALLNLRIPEPF